VKGNGGDTLEGFVIEGGKPLSGSIRVQGAKNAALPILAACVLAEGIFEIHDVPRLSDIEAMCQILEALGAQVIRHQTSIRVNTRLINNYVIPDHLMSKIRSSIFLMGPLLARLKQVCISHPGGCAIGKRPIDIHLNGLKRLGVQMTEKEGVIHCYASKLIGDEIVLDFPSVGATENIMMAAVLGEGTTVLKNAAREPEISDLQDFLNKMGAQITGAGSPEIRIRGVRSLRPVSHTIIPDRIVAGTLAAAAGATGGEVLLENVIPSHLTSIILHLQRLGIEIEQGENSLRVRGLKRLRPIPAIATAPYPGFPTDMQPQMLVLLTQAEGISMLTETIFESRLKHVDELRKMGADVTLDNNTVWVRGGKSLNGTSVSATDLRAGAALVIAGLVAQGTTHITGAEHIDRGYERFETVINKLGGIMERKTGFSSCSST
jgi:UDP-N-acetylglucosamine 1-carboxyvinyltransferase